MAVDINELISDQIKEGSKLYPLEKMKSINDLRKLLDYLDEEIYKETPKVQETLMEDVTTLFFLKKYYSWLGKQMKGKPTMTQEKYSQAIRTNVLNEIDQLNVLGDRQLVENPLDIASTVEIKLTKEILQHWFSAYNQVERETQADPKGLERMKRIQDSYTEAARGGNKGLSKGTLMINHANGGCLMFMSPKRDEVVVLYLVKSRKIEFQQKLPYEKEVKKESIGGSVSGTTLKLLKETLRNFTNNSIDKDYWSEVLKIVETNI